jgi:predicted RecA/RadA family phage recombinase
MNRTFARLLAVAALAGIAACTDVTSPANISSALLSEAQVTNDLAVSSAEVVANDIGEMIANEVFAGMPSARPSFDLFGSPPGVTVNRTRSCLDQNGQAQSQCDPLTTASIVFTLTMNGSFTRTASGPRGTDSMTVAVHRTRNTTVSGLLGTETSRTHDGLGTSTDTTHLVGIHENVTLERVVAEASVDSVQSVVFNLPRAANPFPVSGKIVRRVTGTVALTVNGQTANRAIDRVVTVTFPPDGQGNVTMTITAGGTTKTCQLNLVTRQVTGCQ